MKKCYYLALALLLLVITPVAAVDYPYSEQIRYSTSTVDYYDLTTGYNTGGNTHAMYINDIETLQDLKQIVITDLHPAHVSNPNQNPSGKTTFSLGNYAYGDLYYSVNFVDGVADSVQCWFDFTEWSPSGSGDRRDYITYNTTDFAFSFDGHWVYNSTMPNDPGSIFIICGYTDLYGGWSPKGSKCGTYYVYQTKQFEHDLTVDEYDNFYQIELDKLGYYSSVDIIDDEDVTHYSQPFNNVNIDYNLYKLPIKPPVKVNITDKYDNYYEYTIVGESTEEPTPTQTEEPTQPVLRTGTVTMTDNNGTTIRGFEVTAVNAYTGEEYTVATDTDVAVMTLPMDRTITIRNPQTGEYEDTTVGYYRFFGQSPGYKMLNEEGIQVAVMPEKYSSYQLCDILVTQESGYLTGKHQFQIRSRSDNSILQTGTISAKSATTGEWYNTTLSGGLATLVLPYDTSNPISQYAGNYYVYATSPGYQDSDYGTQIVVMPHTVSEINTIHLTPIGGVPTPGNVTLRIQAFSETGPGVVNAEIFIAGVQGAGESVWDTYTASSTGYLEFSVPGNSTYDIVASGAGYYDSARRIEVFTEDPPLIEIKLYLSGAPTLEPTTQPTGWPTTQPTTQPTGGIPDDDDGSGGFLMQAVRGIGLAFGVGFSTAKLIFGMLLALSIGYATAKHLRGGAAEFGIGLMGGTLLGVLVGLLPVWIIVVLLLVVGLYIGNQYVRGANNG